MGCLAPLAILTTIVRCCLRIRSGWTGDRGCIGATNVDGECLRIGCEAEARGLLCEEFRQRSRSRVVRSYTGKVPVRFYRFRERVVIVQIARDEIGLG